MLRLWPDTAQIGLFAGHCWLAHAKLKTVVTLEPEDGRAGLLAAFTQLLSDPAHQLRKGTRLSVTISDQLAALCALQWQEDLHKQDELNLYARMCFEKMDRQVNDGWAVHAELRRYGATGIAYALPQEMLEQLAYIASQCGMRLQTAMPVSAAAYFNLPRTSKQGQSVLLLQEKSRLSAIVHDRAGMIAYDVEPVTGSVDMVAARQLRRLAATHGKIDRVWIWAQNTMAETVIDAVVSTELPHAKRQQLLIQKWG